MEIRIESHAARWLPCGIAVSAALILSALPNLSRAEFEIGVELGVHRASNIFLSADDEVDDTIFKISPGFRWEKVTPRMDANAQYIYEWFKYSDLDETQGFHQLDADFEFTLVPDNLFLNVAARRDQAVKNTEDGVPADNTPITDNRMDRDELSIGPAFEFELGNYFVAEGDYTYSYINYDDSFYDNLDNNQSANFQVANFRRGQGISLGVTYAWRKTKYKEESGIDPWEHQQAVLQAGYWFGANTRVFAGGGVETPWDEPFERTMSASIWEVGFDRRLGDHFTMELAAGERSFGNSARGELGWTFRTGNMSIEYLESPTTEGREPYSPGLGSLQEVPFNFLTRPGSTLRFILKDLRWNIYFDLERTEFSTVIYSGRRTNIRRADGTEVPGVDPDTELRQRGISLWFSRQLRRNLDFRLSYSFAESDRYDLDGTIEYVFADAGLTYRLGERTGLSLVYAYSKNRNVDSDSESGGYEYDSIGLVLTWRLR